MILAMLFTGQSVSINPNPILRTFRRFRPVVIYPVYIFFENRPDRVTFSFPPEDSK